MKRTLARAVLLVLLISSPVASRAQPLPPPEELSELDVLLGNWKGAGVFRETPGAPEARWTAVSTGRKVLSGHAIQVDERIDLGPESPAPLIFRTIYAFDRETSGFRFLTLSNMEGGGVERLHRGADGRIVGSTTMVKDGQAITDQWVFKPAKDRQTIRMLRSVGGGEFYVHVEGSYERGDEAFDAAEGTAGAALAPPAADMRALEPRIGAWRVTGSFKMSAEAPALPISGRETIRSILGGHVQLATIAGDPTGDAAEAYAAEHYTYWDPREKRYSSVGFDNHGGFESGAGYLLDKNRFVAIGAQTYMGVPQATRTILEWSEETRTVTIVSHALAGAGAPYQAFEGKLEKAEERKGP